MKKVALYHVSNKKLDIIKPINKLDGVMGIATYTRDYTFFFKNITHANRLAYQICAINDIAYIHICNVNKDIIEVDMDPLTFAKKVYSKRFVKEFSKEYLANPNSFKVKGCVKVNKVIERR